MPDVSSIGSGPVGPVNRPGLHHHGPDNGRIRTDPNQPASSDRVELSDHARLLDEIRRLPEVRSDRVEAVREALDAGTYETEDRLNTAIERLLEDIG
jgi:anti-sigma28 factor (negative regulator of flagellin synthesis)